MAETRRWTVSGGAFELHEQLSTNDSGWVNFRLCRVLGRGRKNVWWLGWNGERLTGGMEPKLLAEYEPDTYGEVIKIIHGIHVKGSTNGRTANTGSVHSVG